MRAIRIPFEPSFADWRAKARSALLKQIPPQDALWEPTKGKAQGSIFGDEFTASQGTTKVSLPKQFLEMAEKVACHSDTERWDLLYRLAWRLRHEDKNLLQIVVDNDVNRFFQMEKAIRYECHKTKAFVRFKVAEQNGEEIYLAWFEPKHPILPLVAPFFARRFASMHWMIKTPQATATWNKETLRIEEHQENSAENYGDPLEDLWRNYYRSIYNPSRMKRKAMQGHMPMRFWKGLPEAEEISDLIREQSKHLPTYETSRASGAEAFLPEDRSQESLRKAIQGCQGCEIHQMATQAVFGEGPLDAEIVLVGEQPGDEEDKQGKVFVGPAGKILDQALKDAGIQRNEIYITNAVKHFKWRPEGKTRLHQRPRAGEIAACSAWLYNELRNLKPKVLICLGATAAQSLLGKVTKISDQKNKLHKTQFCEQTVVTIHPSYILRQKGENQKSSYNELVQTLKQATKLPNTIPKT